MSVPNWSKDQRGNVSIMFALSLMALMICFASAIDYLRLAERKTKVSAATDAAVLAGITSAMQADKAGKANAKGLGMAAALAMWTADIGPELAAGPAQPTIALNKTGDQWTASIDYDTTMPTAFMNLFGIDSMALASHVKSSSTVDVQKTYWEFNLAVDTSNSMGIGATKADMDAISAKVQSGCTFACHFTGSHPYFKDTFTKAHSLGIKLRLDVVNDAVSAVVAEMQAITDGSHIKAALTGLDRDATELVSLTTNLQSIVDYKIALTNAIVYPTQNIATGDTDYAVSLATLAKNVGAAGDGTTASTARKAVFIVTDGIHDSYSSESNVVLTWPGEIHHNLGPIDPAFCQSMKDKGVLVGVLYIDYIIPPGYDSLINPYKSDVLPKLQACASDNMFHNATSAADIKDALSDMLHEAMNSTIPRLTQ